MDTGSLVRAALLVVAAFFIGGIPFGVVVARLVGGPDPRTLGSGRTGGANVMRAIGPGWALVAGLLDMLKGTAAILLVVWAGGGPWVEVLAGCAAIIGHSRSPYLRFNGGRGVSVAFGTLLVLGPIVAALLLPVFLVIVLVSGYSSLASLVGAIFAGAAFLVIQLANGGPPAFVAYAVVGPILIWLFHADNIRRLLAGTERRLDWRRRATRTSTTDPPVDGAQAGRDAGASGTARPGGRAGDPAPPVG